MTPRNHSRLTGALRLVLAIWLIVDAVRILAFPQQAALDSDKPLSMLLPLAGLEFAVGGFLLTGFMSRVMGLVLVAMGVWQWSLLFAVMGVYFALRGGGAWAMDIYVQKMQDKVRMRDVSSRQSS